MSNKRLQETPRNKINFEIQQKSQSNQIEQTKINSGSKDSKPYIIIDSSKFGYLNSPIQNLLSKARKLIKKGFINEAIVQITNFLKIDEKKQKLSLSPSKILGQPQHQNINFLDLYFCLVNCLMHKHKYSQALKYLNELESKKLNYKPNVTLLIAICYSNLQNFQKTLQVIQKTQEELRTSDHLFLKSKTLKKLQRFEQCQQNLKQTIDKYPDHFQSVQLLLGIYRNRKQYSQSLSLIDHSIISIDNQSKIKQLRLKKAELQYLNQQFEAAFKSIQHLEKHYHIKQSKLNYLKGKISLKINKFQDSIIYFSQAVQIHSNIHFARLALSELIIYFLRQRDFYEASSHCKRFSYISLQKNQLIQNLSFLAQGLILLMKRNFEEGLRNINKINLSKFQLCQSVQNKIFLQNLYHNSRGFSFFSLGKHKQALKSYQKMILQQDQQQYSPCLYNIKLCEGILNMTETNSQQKSIQCFQKAIDYLLRPQPYFYISVILTQKNLKYEGSSQIFMKILSILQSGLNVNPTSQMHFYRALVFMFLGMNVQAIQDIDKAIQISEDNVVQHFYAKSIIYFLQDSLQQAISQFQVALSIDQKNQKVIIEKAKCQLLHGNYQQAYIDLQLYRQIKKTEKDIKPWELYFLLYERKFEQILQLQIKDYINDSKNQLVQSIQQIKNTCSFFLGRFQECGPSGKLVLALIYETFEQLLKLLNQALDLHVNVGPLSQIDLKSIKGYVLFRLKRYDESIITYQQMQNMLTLNQKQWTNQQIELKFLIIKINQILCLYAKEDVQNCKEKLQILINQINQGEVLDQLKQIQRQLSDPERPQDQEFTKQPYIITLFNEKQMLSSFLPLQTINKLALKPIIPFPILEVPQLKPNRQKMLQQFDFLKIQNRPEAPWIKRGQFGVLFTNQIQQYNNLHLNTQETQVNPKQKLIDDLKLGSEVLLKLQRFKGLV